MAKPLPGTALPVGAEGSTEAEGKLTNCMGARVKEEGTQVPSARDVGEPPLSPLQLGH